MGVTKTQAPVLEPTFWVGDGVRQSQTGLVRYRCAPEGGGRGLRKGREAEKVPRELQRWGPSQGRPWSGLGESLWAGLGGKAGRSRLRREVDTVELLTTVGTSLLILWFPDTSTADGYCRLVLGISGCGGVPLAASPFGLPWCSRREKEQCSHVEEGLLPPGVRITPAESLCPPARSCPDWKETQSDLAVQGWAGAASAQTAGAGVVQGSCDLG